jgi:hypothetical protein
MNDFKNLPIWKNAFGKEGNEKAKLRLESALDTVRKNADSLGVRISTDFPNLTIHDVTHMDALWKVADLLVGNSHNLNPLEVFVVGCTFYLHDAALCFDAYEGGRDAVRATNVWKDASWRHKQNNHGEADANEYADFDAVRALHAQQAEKIAFEGWRDQVDGNLFFLIEDHELREQHGRLIGQVAASHHWDLRRVHEDLQDIQTPVASLPGKWTIRPVLLACVLRCADAAQVDGTRAPENLLRLLKASGVSLDHWKAQNRIGAISRLANSSKLLITTTKPFTKDDASAWWVMHDTVQILEQELKGSNALLAKTYVDGPVFLVDGVDGNSGPEDLSARIQTQGWAPTSATVKVGDVERVVGALGGQQLYGAGDILAVVARELIQNALDAVSARRVFDPSFDATTEISIELLKHPTTNNWVLRVADKGVGMSPSVLLNALLDFGNSFWASPKASEEFPGLQSKKAQVIGRFGIGFFSIFAIAKSVNVFSRRFDAGHKEFRCLEFPKGLTLRPLHSSSEPEEKLRGFSTVIEVEISPDEYDGDGTFEIIVGHQGQKNFNVLFADFIGSMICNVRASILIVHGNETRSIKVSTEFDSKQANADLLLLSFNMQTDMAKSIVTSHEDRMRVLQDGEKVYGFAALSADRVNGAHFVSSKAIDGLSTPHSRGTDSFVGWIECECLSAKRDAGQVEVPDEVLDHWLDEQIQLYLGTDPNSISRFYTAGHITNFGGDPKSVLNALPIFLSSDQRTGLLTLADIGNHLAGRKLYIPVSEHGFIDQYCRNPGRDDALVVFPYLRGGGDFTKVNIDAGRSNEENSLLSVIAYFAETSGKTATWDRIPNVFESALGSCDALELKLT